MANNGNIATICCESKCVVITKCMYFFFITRIQKCNIRSM